jgi:hypothetical protein
MWKNNEGKSKNANTEKRVKCCIVVESIWNMARIMT